MCAPAFSHPAGAPVPGVSRSLDSSGTQEQGKADGRLPCDACLAARLPAGTAPPPAAHRPPSPSSCTACRRHPGLTCACSWPLPPPAWPCRALSWRAWASSSHHWPPSTWRAWSSWLASRLAPPLMRCAAGTAGRREGCHTATHAHTLAPACPAPPPPPPRTCACRSRQPSQSAAASAAARWLAPLLSSHSLSARKQVGLGRRSGGWHRQKDGGGCKPGPPTSSHLKALLTHPLLTRSSPHPCSSVQARQQTCAAPRSRGRRCGWSVQ